MSVRTPEWMKRTSDAWHSHRKRALAAGAHLDYGLEDLRRLVEGSAYCAYCDIRLTPRSWSCDHAVPVSRGGGFELGNIAIVCKCCNLAKGNATADEFKGLLSLVESWHHVARQSLLTRLRIGGKAFRR
jgi:5-methylcytosine-specific restriction endonuclease McrA